MLMCKEEWFFTIYASSRSLYEVDRGEATEALQSQMLSSIRMQRATLVLAKNGEKILEAFHQIRSTAHFLY